MSASRQLNNFESIEQSYYQAQGAFVGAITQGTPPNPSLEDGLKAQLLADKATESLKNLIARRMAWTLADRLQQSNGEGWIRTSEDMMSADLQSVSALGKSGFSGQSPNLVRLSSTVPRFFLPNEGSLRLAQHQGIRPRQSK